MTKEEAMRRVAQDKALRDMLKNDLTMTGPYRKRTVKVLDVALAVAIGIALAAGLFFGWS